MTVGSLVPWRPGAYRGRYFMPIDEEMTRCVVLIRDERTQSHIGTGFFVTFGGVHGYVVTAGHVAQMLNEPSVALDIRDKNGELETVRLTSEWRFSEPADIAVAEVSDEGLDLIGWPMEKTSDALDVFPQLGADIHYVGLLRPVKSLAERSWPMVRSGTLGAWYQSGVQVKMDKWPHTFRAHLLDVRSRAGFSGSPAFFQMIWTGPLIHTVEAIQQDFPKGKYGSLFYGHALVGMFVGHHDESHTGVVVPIEDIREALMHEDLVKARAKAEAADAERRESEDEFQAMSVDQPYRREDFLSDLRTVTRRKGSEQSDPEVSGTEA